MRFLIKIKNKRFIESFRSLTELINFYESTILHSLKIDDSWATLDTIKISKIESFEDRNFCQSKIEYKLEIVKNKYLR